MRILQAADSTFFVLYTQYSGTWHLHKTSRRFSSRDSSAFRIADEKTQKKKPFPTRNVSYVSITSFRSGTSHVYC